MVLCRALLARGITPVPVVRDAERWRATGLAGAPVIADLTDPTTLAAALASATSVVSCAHARHTAVILAAAPAAERFVLLGSTRRYTRWLDAHGSGVLAGEAAFLSSGRPGVMLHPTMIYGAQGENNVQRLAALLRRLPLVPLPGGGRALVQPVHQDDVTASILAALGIAWRQPESIVIAGPTALPYADFVRAVARAAGLPPPRLVPLPAGLLMAAAPLTLLPGVPRIHAPEIRRLLEDKSFDISVMQARLGITPIDLASGLAATFAHR
jgi:nucleoside-diphosphate-sugar epimerase